MPVQEGIARIMLLITRVVVDIGVFRTIGSLARPRTGGSGFRGVAISVELLELLSRTTKHIRDISVSSPTGGLRDGC